MVRRKKPKVPGQPADPRGGVRNATPGKLYANRTDMAAQPIRTAPNQPYGARAAQEAAQRAVPLPAAPALPAGAATPGATPWGGAPLPDDYVAPGELGAFDRPTERPDEPLTHGLPIGPGAGLEALAGRMPTADPDLEALRPYLATLELLASQPDTSVAARNFIRRVRGGLPPTAQA